MPRTASRARGATSTPPPPCSITRSRDSRRPTPPRASARIPIGRSAITQADRFEPAFLGAIDRALAFAPTDRPQTVEEWARLVRSFDRPCRRCADATAGQRRCYAASRRGAARGAIGRRSHRSEPQRRSRRRRWTPWVVLLLIVIAGAVLERRFRPELQALFSSAPRPVEVAQPATPPVPAPTPQPSQPTPTPPTPTPP